MLGEYAAAVAVGVFSSEEALLLVYHRARILTSYHEQRCPSHREGEEEGMLAVKCSVEVVKQAIFDILKSTSLANLRTLEIAAINGSNAVVITGHRILLESCRSLISAPSKYLPMNQAYHSSVLLPAAEKFGEVFESLISSPLCIQSSVELISTYTGKTVADLSILRSKSYWCAQMTRTVEFNKALQSLGDMLAMKPAFFLEIGFSTVLTSLSRQYFHARNDEDVYLSSCNLHLSNALLVNDSSIYHPRHNYHPVYLPWRQVHSKLVDVVRLERSDDYPHCDTSVNATQTVIDILEQAVDAKASLLPSSLLASLGLDSLLTISCRHQLCARLSIPMRKLPIEVFSSLMTISDLVNHIQQLLVQTKIDVTLDSFVVNSDDIRSTAEASSSDSWGNTNVFLPALSMQRGMFFHIAQEEVAESSHHSFLETFHWKIRGNLNIARLERSFCKLLMQYPQLCSSFQFHALPFPLQVFPTNEQVIAACKKFKIQIVDLTQKAANSEELKSSVRDILMREQTNGFGDFEGEGPYFRVTLLTMPAKHSCTYHLIWTLHHLLVDGVSLTTLLHYLNEIYASSEINSDNFVINCVNWSNADVYSHVLQYEHHLLSSTSEYYVDERNRVKSYWQNTVHVDSSAISSLSVDSHFFASMITDLPDENCQRMRFVLDPRLTKGVNALADIFGYSKAVVYHAVWASCYLLLRYSLQLNGHCTTDNISMETWYGCTMSNRAIPLANCLSAVGLALNTLPFLVRLPSNASLSNLLETVHASLMSVVSHQSYPLAEILALSDRSKFGVIFDYQQSSWNTASESGLCLEEAALLDRTGFPLSIRVIDDSKEVALNMTSECSVMTTAMLEFINDVFIETLSFFVDNASRKDQLQRLSFKDCHKYVRARSSLHFQAQHPVYDLDKVHVDSNKLVRDGVFLHSSLYERRESDDLAVVCGGHQLSYRTLSEYTAKISDYLATIILKSSLTKTPVIAIVMERGWEQVVAMNAVLSVGAAYLPMDAGLWPISRIEFVLKHSEAIAVISTSLSYAKTLSENYPNTTSISLREDINPFIMISLQNLDVQPDSLCSTYSLGSKLSSIDLAYLIYTSGSTGTPKGVCGHHIGALNTILDLEQRFHVDARDRVFALSSSSFDLSVFDIFGMMRSGGTIVYPDPALSSISIPDPEHWLQACSDHHVTIWNSVPALMEIFVTFLELTSSSDSQSVVPSLRLVMLSGDKIPMNLPQRIWKAFSNPSLRVVCLGGATEASIWSNYFEVTYPGTDILNLPAVPYGRPLANQSMYILDNCHRHCPPNKVGTIFIGGVGLAHGYHRNDPMNKKHFVKHPVTDEILFRTGDLGRVRDWNVPDSATASGLIIEILGREDFQVKLRGYRIELGEIESTILQASPQLQSALVSLHEDELCAYVVFHPHVAAEDHDDILDAVKAHCHAVLASYMQPKHFIPLASFPLTANGKVDRSKLTLPKSLRKSKDQDISPQSEDRRSVPHELNSSIVAKIWKKVLRLADDFLFYGDENFFKIGGDSLKSVAVVSEFRSIGKRQFSVQNVFQYSMIGEFYEYMAKNSLPSLRVLGQHSDNIDAADDCILVKADESSSFPLHGMNVAHFVGLHTTSFAASSLEAGIAPQIYFEWLLKDGLVDIDRLEKSFNQFIERHEVFRCVVSSAGSMQLLEPVPIFRVSVDKIHHHPDQVELMSIRSSLMTANTFQFNVWPLFDVHVSNLSSSSSILHVRVSLFLLDAISDLIFRHELSALYRGQLLAPPPSIRYRDYTHTLVTQLPQTSEYQRARDFWVQKLSKISASLSFPLKVHDSNSTARELSFENRNVWLDSNEYRQFRRNCQHFGVTIPTTLLGIYAMALYIHAPQPRPDKFLLNILFCTRRRVHEEVSSFVGNTSSTMLAEINMTGVFDDQSSNSAGGVSWLQYLTRIATELSINLSHSAMSGLEVMAELNRKLNRQFQAVAPFIFTSPIGVEVEDGDVMRKDWIFNETFFSERVPHTACVNAVKNDELGRMCASIDSIRDVFADNLMDHVFESYRQILLTLCQDQSAWESPANRLWSSSIDSIMLSRVDPPTNRDTMLRLSSPSSATNAGEQSSHRLVSVDDEAFHLPSSPLEQKILTCLAKVLKMDELGISCTTSLFALGGNSLTAIQFLHELRSVLKVNVSIAQLYQNPSCRQLASLYKSVDDDSLVGSQQQESTILFEDAGISMHLLHAAKKKTKSMKVFLFFNPAGASAFW
jgi:amino acid adenylation domain-containing protein